MKAFITGIGGGIGLETCKQFLSKGWDVVGVIRNPAQENQIKRATSSLLGELSILNLDLSQSNFKKQLDDYLSSSSHKDFNVLVNIAGVLNPMPIQEYDFDKIQEIVTVNFISPTLLIQSIIPYMNGSNSHNIVNISSMSGFQGSVRFPGLGIYGASKAALSSITESLSEELKEKNIHINALAIGSVNTNMLKEAFPDYTSSMQPNEMASYIFSFATHGFKFYNGKTLPVAITNP